MGQLVWNVARPPGASEEEEFAVSPAEGAQMDAAFGPEAEVGEEGGEEAPEL